MTLTTASFELLSDPKDSKIICLEAAVATGATAPIRGRGVEMNSSGQAILLTAVASIVGIALETPEYAGQVIDVLLEGKVRVKDTDNDLVYHAKAIAATNDPVFMEPTGKYHNTTTSNTQIGIATNVVSAVEDSSEFEAEIAINPLVVIA